MKVNLLYCPFVDPVTPPLGIASLKAYVEARSDVAVRAIDLNLEWHHRLVAEVRDARARGQLPAELEAFDAAAALLLGKGDEFFDLDRYNAASVAFINVSRSLHLRSIRDLTEAKVAEFLGAALDGDPDVVGFSILFDEQVAFSLALARVIKRVRPDKTVVFGGAALDSSFQRIVQSPDVDYAVRDSGEAPLTALLVSLAAGALDQATPGLVWKRDGSVVSNDVVRADMDSHPYPDFSDHRLDAYFTHEIVIPVLSQKGCYWAKCSFCAEGSLNVYSKASVTRVVDELEHQARRGHRYFHFVDEMIAAKRFREISEEILRRGLDVAFYAYLRPGFDYDQETLDVMYRAGCRYVVWGLESANPRVLHLVNKGTTTETIRRTFERSSKAGIRNHAFVMVGFPSETPAELLDTMQFIYENAVNIHHTHRSFFCLLEGTAIHEHPEQYGVEILADGTVRYPEGTTTASGEALMVFYYDTFLKDLEIAPAYGVFRDHALLHYTRFDLAAHQQRRTGVAPPTLPLSLLCGPGFRAASLLENPMRNHLAAPKPASER